MADPVDRPEILMESTPRERATEAVDGRFEDLDTDLIARVRSPADAPVAYLPYLAWERSVDVYDPLWPESVKRAAIAAAPIVHRYKGTRYAVAVALSALRIDAEIVEWWQASPKRAPYTFRVKAYARARLYDGPLLSPQLISAAYASILRAKPESRAFDLTVGVNVPASLGLIPVLAAKTIVARAVVPAQPNTHTQNVLGLAPVIVGKVRVARAVVPILPP